jgi:hypothetical protein
MPAEGGGDERWREAKRVASALVRAHESVREQVMSLGRKIIDTGRLVFILLKLSVAVLDENRC